MIKLNYFRRLFINTIYAIALFIMFGIPIFFGIKIIYENIEYVDGNRLALNWAVFGVFIMTIFGIIYIKYFRKWFHRKLIGLQVRDELGFMPVKGFLGVITDRILRTLEYVYPFFITLIILYISKYMFGQFVVFEKLFELNVKLLYLALAGFGIFLVGDFTKIEMMKQQEIINRLNIKTKSDKLELKKLKNNNKRQRAALAIEKELEALKNQ